MSITVNRAAFAKALSIAAKIAALKQGIAVGQCVRLEANGGTLRLAATDFDHWINLSIGCEGELDPICIHAGRLSEVMAAARSESVTLELEEGRVRATYGRGRCNLASVPATDFPQPEFVAETSFKINADRLRDVIRFTAPTAAPADDTTKPGLAGVHLVSRDGQLKAVSTDRFNLMMVDVIPTSDVVSATVATKAMEIAADIPPGEIEVGLTGRAILFRWPGGSLRGPLLQDDFVPFERAIADEFASLATVEAKDVLNALRAVRPLGDDDRMSRSKRVRLTFNGKGMLSANSHEGDAEEEFPADWTGEGELVIGVAASRLEKMLRGFGDSVLTLKFNSPLEPFLIEAAGKPDRLGALFPMYV